MTREAPVRLPTSRARLFLFVRSRRVERGRCSESLWPRKGSEGDICTPDRERGVRERAVVCTYMRVCDERERVGGGRDTYTRVHVPGGPANKYNATAWAAIVRTHKVETRAKPTVNRRFRS